MSGAARYTLRGPLEWQEAVPSYRYCQECLEASEGRDCDPPEED